MIYVIYLTMKLWTNFNTKYKLQFSFVQWLYHLLQNTVHVYDIIMWESRMHMQSLVCHASNITVPCIPVTENASASPIDQLSAAASSHNMYIRSSMIPVLNYRYFTLRDGWLSPNLEKCWPQASVVASLYSFLLPGWGWAWHRLTLKDWCRNTFKAL